MHTVDTLTLRVNKLPEELDPKEIRMIRLRLLCVIKFIEDQFDMDEQAQDIEELNDRITTLEDLNK